MGREAVDAVNSGITAERAASRYFQMRTLELTARRLEAEIADGQKAIDEAEERIGELRKQKGTVLKELRLAANDEGRLPLFHDLEADAAAVKGTGSGTVQ